MPLAGLRAPPVILCLAGSRRPGPAQADFRSCLSGLRGQAAAKGISGATFEAATRGSRRT